MILLAELIDGVTMKEMLNRLTNHKKKRLTVPRFYHTKSDKSVKKRKNDAKMRSAYVNVSVSRLLVALD